ncbi:hypothetical protein FAGAP_24 [Fusarium agapanthi]|uniref:Sulfotransferase family protein n=1 Tax=Fusarium agapanthi TaxID=1803897 RepID=A0A9P5BRR9_9HYPO|nr:hypothetical protein FAGAP_24 [Fusarium agapanthi]
MSNTTAPKPKRDMKVLCLGLPRTGTASMAEALHAIDEGVLKQLWNPIVGFSIHVVEPLLGSRAGIAARKQMLGLFQAETVEEARKNARETYERHHRVIREMVPEEQLLEYRMGQGWEPICEFLDKPVPETEFPWVNEAAELRRTVKEKAMSNLVAAVMVVMPWAGAVAALGAGYWMIHKR